MEGKLSSPTIGPHGRARRPWRAVFDLKKLPGTSTSCPGLRIGECIAFCRVVTVSYRPNPYLTVLILFSSLSCFAGAPSGEATEPLPVKVVVLTMFEQGEDRGDAPGEFQFWVEREGLDTVYPMPHSYHPVRANDQGVIGTVTGVGTARAAASVMALGLDPRFDLT